MSQPVAATDPFNRLARLEGYLQQDPANPRLLADASEAALACGRHAEADSWLAAAQQLEPESVEWPFRRAHVCIARRDLSSAQSLLEQLQGRCGEHPALLHDLAYVHLLRGEAAEARALLENWAGHDFRLEGVSPQQAAMLQATWLRACHRMGALDEAWAAASRWQAAETLQAGAAGIAALIALDMDELPAAHALAEWALRADAAQHEALVALGSLALVEGRTAEARERLQQALLRHPEDGRTWSALGFASLMDQDLPRAHTELERAVASIADHIPTWQALGWTRMLLRDVAGALAAFETALLLDETRAESHAALGLAQVLAGSADPAGCHLQSAERLDPDGALAQLARGLMRNALAADELQALLQRLIAQWRPRP